MSNHEWRGPVDVNAMFAVAGDTPRWLSTAEDQTADHLSTNRCHSGESPEDAPSRAPNAVRPAGDRCG